MSLGGLFEGKGRGGLSHDWAVCRFLISCVKSSLSCMKGHGLASGYGNDRGHGVGIDCTHLLPRSRGETFLTCRIHKLLRSSMASNLRRMYVFRSKKRIHMNELTRTYS